VLLISPENAYLASYTIPQSQTNYNAVMRAFSAEATNGRLVAFNESNSNSNSIVFPVPYAFRPFRLTPTTKAECEFEFSRRYILSSFSPSPSQLDSTSQGVKNKNNNNNNNKSSSSSNSSIIKISNLATIWNPVLCETLIKGALQGWNANAITGNERGASALCRKKMFMQALELNADTHVHLSVEGGCDISSGSSSSSSTCASASARDDGVGNMVLGRYIAFKRNSESLLDRRLVKKIVLEKGLKGWVANVDDDFDFSML
jgi:hypothetical protein